MQSLNSIFAVIVAVGTAMSVPTGLAAQDKATQAKKAHHHHYKLIDLGTLGGPSAYKSVNAPGYQIINNSGVVGFSADTAIPDPNAPNCAKPDCFINHVALWKNGKVTDLGALESSTNVSSSGAINARGWIAGQSNIFDPGTGQFVTRAVLWTHNQILNLGTFGGDWSLASTLNDEGQVVGFATNAIPDPYPMFLGGTQTRAFLWQNGILQDLGTLGGPDAQGLSVNQRGQITGISYTDPNETTNPTTGFPTTHPFLWDHGTMIDLGTLGGTFAGPFGPDGAEGSMIVNNRGQVIGVSTLSGDTVYHPFLWDHGTLTDLGTLGGDDGTAIWLTDTGDVVGEANLPNYPPGCTGLACVHHAYWWSKGAMTDLGTLGTDTCSRALMMNSKGQIVGTTIAVCGYLSSHAFLWEDSGPMVDLQSMISDSSSVSLFEADNINEGGEIVASGLPDGCVDRFSCGHLYLLIPCDENHPDIEGCDYSMAEESASTMPSTQTSTDTDAGLSPDAIRRLPRAVGPGSRPWNRGLRGQPPK